MTASRLPRRLLVLAGAVLPLCAGAAAIAQESLPWNAPQDSGSGQGYGYQGDGSQSYDVRSYRAQESGGQGYTANQGDGGGPADYAAPGTNPYSPPPTQRNIYSPPRDAYNQNRAGYAPSGGYAANGGDAYSPNSSNGGTYSPSGGGYSANGGDAYSPPRTHARNDSFTEPGEPSGGGGAGYGEPYAPPPGEGAPLPYREGPPPAAEGGYYSQNEIVTAGHGFFGAISQGLASAVEYVFKSQGRPNGYILGEDAGGAFVVGLRYGEGKLYTKDAGDHKVFWQGPTVGYDAGAEGSKTMVLVYNLHDPSEIYNRFGGVQGAAYLVGGVSVQFQTYGDVKLAVIRSGVGLRLGANVGYLNYTRTPTWNPL